MGFIVKGKCNNCEFITDDLYTGSGNDWEGDTFNGSTDDKDIECMFPYYCKSCENITMEDVTNHKNISCRKCNGKELEPCFVAKINYSVTNQSANNPYIDRVLRLFSSKYREQLKIKEKNLIDKKRKTIEYISEKYGFKSEKFVNRNTFSWNLDDKKVNITLYLNNIGICPKCRNNSLTFEKIGLWD